MTHIALITGASSGIGAATALALSATHQLVLVARRRERLTALVERITTTGGTAWAVVSDLERQGEPERVVAEAVRLAGGLDVVINNAGVFLAAGIGSIPPADIERQLRINLQVPILLAQAAVPHLAARGGGTIVNVSSVAAETTFVGCSVYSATKAALDCWSRVAREELRPQHIRVCVVAPGATDSEVWSAESMPDRHRMCRPEDVANAIRFMLEQPATASIDRLVIAPPGGAL